MADRLQDITSTNTSREACDDCAEDGPCEHHWLVEEVHRLRGAIRSHSDKVQAHRDAARERHASLAGEDDLHGIHQDLWSAVDGRDTPV